MCNEYKNIDADTLQNIVWYHNDLNKLLPIVNQLAMVNYDNGYAEGYEEGNNFGWCDCYDSLCNEDD